MSSYITKPKKIVVHCGCGWQAIYFEDDRKKKPLKVRAERGLEMHRRFGHKKGR